MGDTNDRLSVVMPVRNAMPYLDESIASIVNQTHHDFEFVIGDDGSTDGSSEVLRDWAKRDPRIRLFTRSTGSGPVASSNWVVEQASGGIIARMDADDISHPDRLRRQLAVMREHPDAVMVASLYEGIDLKGRKVRDRDLSTLLRQDFTSPFAHGSVMLRRDAFDRAGRYRPECEYWEDLDLYLRMLGEGRILVLPDILFSFRYSDTSTRQTSAQDRVERATDLFVRCGEHYMRGEDYAPILNDEDSSRSRRISPDIFWAFASSRIWSGRRSGVVRRAVQRAAFPQTRQDFRSWCLILWGSISPASLRYFIRRRMQRRDEMIATPFPDGKIWEWRRRPVGRATYAG